jgi:hypothetical protein
MSFIGFFIGFSGYLMLGNINLAVVELGSKNKILACCQLIFFAVLFESFYVVFTFYCFDYLSSNQKFSQLLQAISILLTICVGIWNLFTKNKISKKPNSNIVFRAYFSMILHPQQIPYWLVWYEIIKKIELNLFTDFRQFFFFVCFNAVGTSLVLILYSKFGNKILYLLSTQTDTLARFMGVYYILMAVFQIFTFKF